MANYSFRGLSVTREQFYALRQVERSNLTLPAARISAESVGDERRIKLAFADGHEVSLRPNGDPA